MTIYLESNMEKRDLDLNKTVARIQQMDALFDILLQAEKARTLYCKGNEAGKRLPGLVRYYENGQWLEDYELDEAGVLPQWLKRGVLAQDSVYDFLERNRELQVFE